MRLSNHDASFLYSETASGPMHGSAFYVFDGEIPFETIFGHYEKRIHLVPHFRKRLVFVPGNIGHPKLVEDPDFKLESHLIQHKLRPGATLETAIEEGLALAEPLLDRTRPLWKIFVLEGVPNQTLLLSLMHHAVVDGATAVEMSTVMFDFEPTASDPPAPVAPPEVDPLPSALELFAEAAMDNGRAMLPSNPLTTLTENLNPERRQLFERAIEVTQEISTRPVLLAPWNAGTVGPKRKLVWATYEFDDVRTIRKAFGGTINDVALTVVTEAVARYLDFHKHQTQGQYLRMMCPVNVRREDEAGAMGNRVSSLQPVVPAWPMEIDERHQRVRSEMHRRKENQEAQALRLLMEAPSPPPIAMAQTLLVGTPFDPTQAQAQTPPALAPRSTTPLPHYGFNFTLTNVPGPQMPQYLAGHEMLMSLGSLMLSGSLGFGAVVGSYARRLSFMFTSEARLMPDVERVRDCSQEVMKQMLAESHERLTTTDSD